MTTKMLIDKAHAEETRVVVVGEKRVEDFDYESASRKPLKGNIYLAKVVRVEPSLQAAFVDYGGNRHGFLAFSEIHPDYYQIPVADRQALLEDVGDDGPGQSDAPTEVVSSGSPSEEEPDVLGTDQDQQEDPGSPPGQGLVCEENNLDERKGEDIRDSETAPSEEGSLGTVEHDDAPSTDSALSSSSDDLAPTQRSASLEREEDVHAEALSSSAPLSGDFPLEEEVSEESTVEEAGAGVDDLEDLPPRHRTPRRIYKIQEVIRRRQIILVQVNKEERGNKGAALTTYLSLAGRYCVLMPNTARGGGVSRKISDPTDRSRLKELIREIDVPEGMGLIVRTAGAQRTKLEIKRDFDYLIRLWSTIREHTLSSKAPWLVHEEGSLIKRALRDLYSKEIDEVLVEGEQGYHEARSFMKMLMPSHLRSVKLYRDKAPLFTKYNVENQLDALFSPTVTLPSGGYLVINQTEALVAIDINSGRATREHNIEDTALKTNLEAADEVARQLRLRDLAGLVVIDFIDMEEQRNNRIVEKRMKDALKSDRARIQIGKISPFGLLEMSRQRLRPGILEATTVPCSHCEGRGVVRSMASCALGVLRLIEQALLGRSTLQSVTVSCHGDVGYYILNEKRAHLLSLEQRYGVSIFLKSSNTLGPLEALVEAAPDRPFVPLLPEPLKGREARRGREEREPDAEEENDPPKDKDAASDVPLQEPDEDKLDPKKRKRRRRGRRGGGAESRETRPVLPDEEGIPPRQETEAVEDGAPGKTEGNNAGDPKNEEDEGRRGGRRGRSRRRSGGLLSRGRRSSSPPRSEGAHRDTSSPLVEPQSIETPASTSGLDPMAPTAPEGVGQRNTPAPIELSSGEAASSPKVAYLSQPTQGPGIAPLAKDGEQKDEKPLSFFGAMSSGLTSPEGEAAEKTSNTSEQTPVTPAASPRRFGWWRRK